MKIIEKYQDKINGVLSTFDRIIIKGHILQFYSDAGKRHFLSHNNIPYKDFGTYANTVTAGIRKHVLQFTDNLNRPYSYLNSPKISKEKTAMDFLKEKPIESGLICTLGTLELCNTLLAIKNKETQKLELRNVNRKCIYYYLYFLDPEFGFMHVKLQTWFPFQIQVYVNGREILAKKLDEAGIKYDRYDNSFTYVSDVEKAQTIADKLESMKITKRLDSMAFKLNSFLPTITETFNKGYYWCVDQCEYATDIMFKSRKDLEEIYPSLVEHALVGFKCEDVMTFMGRKMHHAFQGEIVSDIKKRPQGIRIKHRMKSNIIKMYDKWNVLRIETTINDPHEFKIYKEVERKGKLVKAWVPMGKSIANIYRYAQVSKTSNERYGDALADAVPTGKIVKEVENVAQRKRRNKRVYSGFNVWSPETSKLFLVVMDGAHFINGFTNRDLCKKLYPKQSNEKKFRSKVTRLLAKLRAHGLIRKVPRSRRYQLTSKGRRVMSGVLYLKEKEYANYVVSKKAC